MKFRLQKIAIKSIRVRGNHRPLVKKKLPVIAESMDAIGLKTPITVRKANEIKQFNALKKAFLPPPKFIKAWNAGSIAVRRKFGKTCLNPTKKLAERPALDDAW